MRLAAICATLAGACALTGCGGVSNQILGVPPTLQQSNLVADETAQEVMVHSLARKASIDPKLGLAPNGQHWRNIAEAGLVEVDIQCDRYLAALFNFNREQQAARQGLTAAGAATAAILGLSGAAGVTIALLAASVGLAANLFDAGVNSVLFTISPTAVRAITVRGRQAYLAGIKLEDVTTRPRMMVVVQGYLNQCTPAAIESNINNAATGAPSVASSSTDIALKAAASAAPAARMVQNPDVWINSPVTRPTPTPPAIPVSDAAVNVAVDEKSYILTKNDVNKLQASLGVKVNGDMGVAGLPKPGETRTAILEFQTGLKRRVRDPSAAKDVIDFTNFQKLSTGPATDALLSAFERGLIGDPIGDYKTMELGGLGIAIAAMGGVMPEGTKAVQFKALRDAITEMRKKAGSPAPMGRADALDSALYKFATTPQ